MGTMGTMGTMGRRKFPSGLPPTTDGRLLRYCSCQHGTFYVASAGLLFLCYIAHLKGGGMITCYFLVRLILINEQHPPSVLPCPLSLVSCAAYLLTTALCCALGYCGLRVVGCGLFGCRKSKLSSSSRAQLPQQFPQLSVSSQQQQSSESAVVSRSQHVSMLSSILGLSVSACSSS